MTIEIVDFPIENGGSFHSYVNVYQRLIFGSQKSPPSHPHDIPRSSPSVPPPSGAASRSSSPPNVAVEQDGAAIMGGFGDTGGVGDDAENAVGTGGSWTRVSAFFFGLQHAIRTMKTWEISWKYHDENEVLVRKLGFSWENHLWIVKSDWDSDCLVVLKHLAIGISENHHTHINGFVWKLWGRNPKPLVTHHISTYFPIPCYTIGHLGGMPSSTPT